VGADPRPCEREGEFAGMIPVPIAATAYWASQTVQGNRATRQRLKFLTSTQLWEPGRLQQFQLQKLQDLVRHAHDTVPYYRALMDRHGVRPEQIRDFDDYRRLPVLTRTSLRTHGPDLMSRAAGRDLRRRQSSGSTGECVEFVQDADFDRWCRAHQLRAYAWCGAWRLGEPFALVWGAPAYFEARSRASMLDSRLSNRVELNAFRLDRASLERLFDQIVTRRPVLISGYATAIYLLARLARERGTGFPSLRAVQPNAEPLNAAMRTEIEAGFGCDVFDKYGSRETNIVGHEAPDHNGLRIQAEHTYVEFLDEAGNPCPPGVLGRLVLTTLNNRAMPLLRYETTDLAAPLDVVDQSGLGLPAMSPVVGRDQDVLCTPDGGLLHPQMFSNVLRQFPTVAWFQVVQHREDALVLRVVADDALVTEQKDRISALIRELAGFPFAIDFEQLPDMPESRTGKFRLCVCDLPGSRQDRELRSLNDMRAGGQSDGGIGVP
jgi:phenylacetate-CoA ligase